MPRARQNRAEKRSLYAINEHLNTVGWNVGLGMVAIASAGLSLIVFVVHLRPNAAAFFVKTWVYSLLPFFVLIMHVATIVLLVSHYTFHFYPVFAKSVAGSAAFLMLTTSFAVILIVDSRIVP